MMYNLSENQRIIKHALSKSSLLFDDKFHPGTNQIAPWIPGCIFSLLQRGSHVQRWLAVHSECDNFSRGFGSLLSAVRWSSNSLPIAVHISTAGAPQSPAVSAASDVTSTAGARRAEQASRRPRVTTMWRHPPGRCDPRCNSVNMLSGYQIMRHMKQKKNCA